MNQAETDKTTCQHCRFFDGRRNPWSHGYCRRRSPQTTGMVWNGPPPTIWPPTDSRKWCGDFERTTEEVTE